VTFIRNSQISNDTKPKDEPAFGDLAAGKNYNYHYHYHYITGANTDTMVIQA
jgi:hypothetical protein